MSLLPVFLKLDGRLCLVWGGPCCARQDRLAAQDRHELRVVAPRVLAAVRELAVEGRLELVERALRLTIWPVLHWRLRRPILPPSMQRSIAWPRSGRAVQQRR